jgi:hypothetical protein
MLYIVPPMPIDDEDLAQRSTGPANADSAPHLFPRHDVGSKVTGPGLAGGFRETNRRYWGKADCVKV